MFDQNINSVNCEMTSSSPELTVDDDVECLIGSKKPKDKAWFAFVRSPGKDEANHPFSCSSSESFNLGNESLSSEDDSSYHKVPDIIDAISFDDLTMSTEQLQYYSQHFYRMQPNAKAINADSVLTRQFFELSNLPDKILNKIWTLADQNGDGKLNIKEFVNAMHLIVLAVNGLNVDKIKCSLDSLNPYKMLDAPRLSSPMLKEFTSSIDGRCALIAPKPIRISAPVSIRSTTTILNSDDIHRDLRNNINSFELDAKIHELGEKLKSCKSDNLTQQAYINSEVEGSLMHWQRYLRKLKDYRIELECKIQQRRKPKIPFQ